MAAKLIQIITYHGTARPQPRIHIAHKYTKAPLCGAPIDWAHWRESAYKEISMHWCQACQDIYWINIRSIGSWEDYFHNMLCADHMYSFPNWQREYFYTSPNKYRFDFAWPDSAVAVEIDGQYHDADRDLDDDRLKLNAAAAGGWLVLRFSYRMLYHTPDDCLDTLNRTLKRSK